MPKFQVKGDIIASEYWVTEIEAASYGEALEIFEREAKRNFMPEEFTVNATWIEEVTE